MKYNLNAAKNGRRSAIVKQAKPNQCTNCIFRDKCPFYQEGQVCKLRPEFMALARSLGGGKFYEHSVLCNFLSAILQVNTIRYMRAVAQEHEEEIGLDPETSRLADQIFNQTSKLARLLGFDRPDPQVLIDKRTQTVQINVSKIPDGDYAAALESLAQLRQLGQDRVVESLLSGQPIEVVQDDAS